MGVWSLRFLAVGVSLALFGACSGKSKSDAAAHGKGRGGRAGDVSTTSGSGGSGKAGGGSSGSGGIGGMGDGGEGAEECTGPAVAVPTRIVRLDFTQVQNAVADLIGASAADAVTADLDLPNIENRSFPPLLEDSIINDANFDIGDRIGQAVGEYVLQNLATLTNCGATPTDACAERFIDAFAEKAARRPLTDEERANFGTVYDECKAFGGTVQEALQHSVYAVVDSPLFLYRFELGEPGTSGSEVTLAPYEIASLLSFFITNRPPDTELLAAAEDGSIVEPAVLGEHALRLLETPAARVNLDAAYSSYFGLSDLPSVVIDPNLNPNFTLSLLSAVQHEADVFLEDALFGGRPLGEMLTSRGSVANEELAAFYGIDGFPNGEKLDGMGFAPVTLPDVRAGLLTMAGFLVLHGPPARATILRRAPIVHRIFACDPPVTVDTHPMYQVPEDLTELEFARERIASPECASCHALEDPYGIPLYVFDSVGSYRSEDEAGTIDPSVTLPPSMGEVRVESAAELAAELAKPEVFGACIAKSLVEFALAEPAEGAPTDRTACAVRDIEQAFAEGDDPSFAGVVRAVSRSRILTRRVVRP